MADGYQTAYDAYQAGQSVALANLLRGLQAQQAQANAAGQNLAGNALAANGTDPTIPASGMNAPGAPAGSGAPPNLAPPPNPSPMTQVPMPGAAPMSGGSIPPPPMPSQIPQVNASQLQPSGGMGAPPMAPMSSAAAPPAGAPAGQGPAPAPQAGQMGQASQNPWWKTMAAQIKAQNPNASGRDVMAALNAMQPVMNATNKAQLADLRLQMAMQKFQQTGQIDPDALEFIEGELRVGNQSVLTRISGNMRLAVDAALKRDGFSGEDAAAATLNYKGLQSAETTAGHRMGASSVSSEDLKNIGPQAVQAAISTLPKDSNALMAKGTNWLSEMQNDPKYAAFAQLNDDIINAWARSVGGGTANVSTIAEGAKRLGNSRDLQSWTATYNAMLKDIQANLKGGGQAVKVISDQLKPGSASPATSVNNPSDSDGISLDVPPPPEGFVVQ